MEGVNTDTPSSEAAAGSSFFDGSPRPVHQQAKPDGKLDRQASQGVQAWSKYSFKRAKTLQLRTATPGSLRFYSRRRTLNDASVRQIFWPGVNSGCRTRVQYEHWNYPILAAQAQTNISVSVQMERIGRILGEVKKEAQETSRESESTSATGRLKNANEHRRCRRRTNGRGEVRRKRSAFSGDGDAPDLWAARSLLGKAISPGLLQARWWRC